MLDPGAAAHLARLDRLEPAAVVRDGLPTGSTHAVYCVGGPYDRLAFTVAEWRERRVAAARLTAIDARVRPPARYGPGPLPDSLPDDLLTWQVTPLHWN